MLQLNSVWDMQQLFGTFKATRSVSLPTWGQTPLLSKGELQDGCLEQVQPIDLDVCVSEAGDSWLRHTNRAPMELLLPLH